MISIIIPTFNRASVIIPTLESVRNQIYNDWECIIVDDYSKDNTPVIIQSICETDSRFRYYKNDRTKGAQGARNTGILAARGEWIILFDSDNIMKPTFLNNLINKVKYDSSDVCMCWSNVIDCNTQLRINSFQWNACGDISHHIFTGKCYVDNSSTLIRKDLILKIGLLDEGCPAFQEWDTHIRLSKYARYSTLKEYLVDYFTGAKDTISSNKTKDIQGYLFILQKFKKEWVSVSYLHFIRYCAILRAKISLYGGPKSNEYINNYRHLLPLYMRPISYLASIILKNKL